MILKCRLCGCTEADSIADAKTLGRRKSSRTVYIPAAKSQRGLMSSGWRGLRQRTKTRSAVARRRCVPTMKRRRWLWFLSAFADQSRGSEGHELQRVRPHPWKERLPGGTSSHTGYAEYQVGLAIRAISTESVRFWKSGIRRDNS